MERESLWRRMGGWLRRAGRFSDPQLPEVGPDGLLPGVPAGEGRTRLSTVASTRLSKQQMREQALDQLQDGHLRVIGLIDSLQKHMEAQERRGQAIATALDGIAEHIGGLSESARQQTETLGAIAAQLQTGNDRARRWEEAFAEFPALAEAQRATLALLGEQVAAGRRADERIGESLAAVRGALDSLDRSTATSTDVLRRLQESSAREQEAVGELLRKQRTWLVLLVVVTLCVAVAAVTVAVFALVRG